MFLKIEYLLYSTDKLSYFALPGTGYFEIYHPTGFRRKRQTGQMRMYFSRKNTNERRNLKTNISRSSQLFFSILNKHDIILNSRQYLSRIMNKEQLLRRCVDILRKDVIQEFIGRTKLIRTSRDKSTKIKKKQLLKRLTKLNWKDRLI